MSEIILFGGTTEGRQLAECCAEQGIRTVVCVTSEYGHQVLPESPYLCVGTEPLDEAAMIRLIQAESPLMVLDATHPYAAVVSKHIIGACEKTKTLYQRVSRSRERADGEGQMVWVRSVEEAAGYLSLTVGNILVTTGSKELLAYTKIPGYRERVFARVLPTAQILEQCSQYGIDGRHVIAMQGPFSKAMNMATLQQVDARYLVTKEAGKAGGFAEKIQAAFACQATVIAIGRPEKPEGISVEQAMELLKDSCGNQPEEGKKRLVLLGIGMGGSRQLTLEAVARLQESQVVLGADRMLACVREIVPEVPTRSCYLGKDVLDWLRGNTRYQRVCVAYSGDTGFYSGARGLLKDLAALPSPLDYEVEVIPGISTVSCLCAKLGTTWEDACLASVHGRDENPCDLLKEHETVFLLLGGEDSVSRLCRQLTEGGYGDAWVSVGERLSYPEERVVTGRAEDWMEEGFDALAAVLIRRKER